jgi:hypothetical protein
VSGASFALYAFLLPVLSRLCLLVSDERIRSYPESGYWSANFLPFIELFHQVHGEKTILAAVRTLPEGLSAGIVSVVLVYVLPSLLKG